MTRILRDIAAPIPVRMIPAMSTRSCGRKPSGSGSSAENRFINLVNARLSGSCKRSFPSVSSKAPSGLRIRCRMISTATKTV